MNSIKICWIDAISIIKYQICEVQHQSIWALIQGIQSQELYYQLNIQQIFMNRSIAKTRNQLQRITFKINQLKTKYTGDNFNPGSTGAENSPLAHSQYRQKQFSDNRPREPMVSSYQNKFTQPTPTKQSVPTIISSNSNDQTYQKQFKVFRNEMYNYIDKCLLLSKERQQQLIEKTIQTQMQNSRSIGRGKNNLEERIKKIQQQTTNCITSIQDVIVQIKKNQKHFNDKIGNIETKLRRQVKQMGEKSKGDEIINGEQLLKKVQNVQKQYLIFKQDLSKYGTKVDKCDELFEEIGVRVENVQKRVYKKIADVQSSQEECITSRYETLHQKIQNYNKFNVMLEKQILQLKSKPDKKEQGSNVNQKNDQILMKKVRETICAEIQQQMSVLTETLQKNCTDIGSVAESVLGLEHRIQELTACQKKIQAVQLKRKNSEKLYEVAAQKQKSQIMQALEQALTTQIKTSIESSYLKPRLQQVKREFTTKINQQVQLSKQDILINVQETMFEKVNKLIAQQSRRKSPKTEIDESRITNSEQLKQIQSSLRTLIYDQIQHRLPRNSIKIDTAETQQFQQRQKTSPNQQKQNQFEPIQQTKVQQMIEEKLNQFENDINETIKLLYEDIESKVNQMVSHSGMMEFRTEFESTKRDIQQLETKVKSLTLLATSNQTLQKQMTVGGNQNTQAHILQEKIKGVQNLRQQIYSDMGGQIDKLSSILERTFEQMQLKVEKLDRNFSYVYQRMSSIEYDNANFKDKLTSLLEGNKPSPFRPMKKDQPELRQQKSGSNLLDVLGQLNTGMQFFGQS